MIEGFFPATAMPDRDWWAALWPEPAGVLRALGIRRGMAVVDLCCGDGYFTAPLARIVEGQVHAVDIDPAMIEQTRAALKAAGASALSLICADARDLPDLLPGKADCVLIANTFHGVPDKTGMGRAAVAVLKPRGHLAIVNWRPLPREAEASPSATALMKARWCTRSSCASDRDGQVCRTCAMSAPFASVSTTSATRTRVPAKMGATLWISGSETMSDFCNISAQFLSQWVSLIILRWGVRHHTGDAPVPVVSLCSGDGSDSRNQLTSRFMTLIGAYTARQFTATVCLKNIFQL
nr:class I SAM-dependent methyltransferase [Ferruginivarius sediminum]